MGRSEPCQRQRQTFIEEVQLPQQWLTGGQFLQITKCCFKKTKKKHQVFSLVLVCNENQNLIIYCSTHTHAHTHKKVTKQYLIEICSRTHRYCCCVKKKKDV